MSEALSLASVEKLSAGDGPGTGTAGRMLHVASKSKPSLACYLYLPRAWSPNGRVLVSVHGISRNAEEHIDGFRNHADKYGVTLVAPIFAAHKFTDYQRLGRVHHGPRADLALIRLLNEIWQRLGCASPKIDLFGFSGGAQFAQRFALVHPHRVRNLVLGSAGWYTMPDNGVSYPHGTGECPDLDAAHLNMVAAAQIPTLLAVGERDNNADEEGLNRSRAVREAQGDNRLERALNWTNAMRRFADAKGIPASIEFVSLPGVGHSFRDAVVEGGLADRLFEHCRVLPTSFRKS